MLRSILALVLSAVIAGGVPGAAAAQPGPADSVDWRVTVATWNLLNLGTDKVGLPPHEPLRKSLVRRYATIMSQYDIVVVQELLENGQGLTQAIAQDSFMSNYNCSTLSPPEGRTGRQERYGICYAPAAVTLDSVYSYMGQQVTPITGGPQTAQNVWMRPPLIASFTHIKPDSTPFQFSLYVIHTKPVYSKGARPPGTPPEAPATSSVLNELTSLQVNQLQTPLAMFLGDLNADCASYPHRDRGQNFPAPYTWYVGYGEKTNTAPNSRCAYDRIILNDSLNRFYKDHDIYRPGIDERVDGRRVSDHYLVWMELGGRVKRKRLLSSTEDPLTTEQRDYVSDDGEPNPKKVRFDGEGFEPLSQLWFYIINYLPSNYFGGNRSYPLSDVRGRPTPVTVGRDGRFTSQPTWDTPVEGLYTMVLDVNGDGVFNKNDGDFVNNANQIDFIVVHSRAGHNDVVTVGDDGSVRELFNEDDVANVYALGRQLPSNDSVDVWVVSAELLPPGFSWSSPGASLSLDSVSIPVRRRRGPIMVGELTTADRVRRARTSPEGSLFAAVWERPYELMNTAVLTAPLPVPDYKPEYAEEDSIQDPCEHAWESTDTNFQAVCNVGNLFTDYYGTSFNVVLDVNRNGVFDTGDRVDTHDIGDLTAFFAASPDTVLDARANGNPAVGEYKEFLDAKLNLTLSSDDVYDDAVRRGSAQYMCTATPRSSGFPLIQQGAQVGFKMLNQADYENTLVLSGGLYNYAAVDMNGTTVAAGATTCVTTETATIANQTVQANAAPTVIAEQIRMEGTNTVADNSTSCFVAKAVTFTESFAIAVAVVDPEPVSKTAFAVLAAGALAAQALVGVCAGAI